MSNQGSGISDGKLDRPLRKLFRAIADRCRGKSIILGRGHCDLANAIRDRRFDVFGLDIIGSTTRAAPPEASAIQSMQRTLGELPLPEEKFDTVVLAQALEYVPEDMGSQILAEAWQLLSPRGRLIVSVPNQNCISRPHHIRQFNRRSLKKLLQPLGYPKLVTDQPFKWVLMYVDVIRPLNRTWKDRFQVTAKLCHGKVIELGCGEGHLTNVISDRDLEVVGVDTNATMIRRARERYPHINFIQCDIRGLTLPEESFNTVILVEILEHLPEDTGSEILYKAWRLLKPEGRLIVGVPNENCIPHPNHVRQFNRRSLEKLLQPLGKPKLVTDQPFKWLMMYVDRTS
ncbi:MAG: class I SAM-dependent methyltransferase [Acidobacteriota bacterium]